MSSPHRNYRDVVDRILSLSNPLLKIESTHSLAINGKLYPLFRIAIQNGNSKRALLSAGIHGDEPAGVETLCQFLENDLFVSFIREWDLQILPCINPTGFELNSRENIDGVDLNREFKKARPHSEVGFVQEVIDEGGFDLDLELHEDVDSPGYYLYQKELNKRVSPLGRWILDAVETVMPLNMETEIEGLEAERGLLARLRDPEEMEWWPMALYSISKQCRKIFTLETSPNFTMEQRVGAHLEAIKTALTRFEESEG